MSTLYAVVAGRRGESTPRRPVGASKGMRAAAIGAALWTVLAGAAQAQRPSSTQGGRERGVGRLTTREAAGVLDSTLLATVAQEVLLRER